MYAHLTHVGYSTYDASPPNSRSSSSISVGRDSTTPSNSWKKDMTPGVYGTIPVYQSGAGTLVCERSTNIYTPIYIYIYIPKKPTGQDR